MNLSIEEFENYDISKIVNLKYFIKMFITTHPHIKSLNLNKWKVNDRTDLQGLFVNCVDIESIYVDEWNTCNVIDMSYMFYGCKSLVEIRLFKNVSNVLNFSNMFYNCLNLKYVSNIENWNVLKANLFTYMFYNCVMLYELDLSKWNVKNKQTIDYMFKCCPSEVKNMKILKN